MSYATLVSAVVGSESVSPNPEENVIGAALVNVK